MFMTKEIFDAINGSVFGVWFLIGAALVFWMQAGFAMVEAGFTRAKNTGNIIMKNLMDFCIGTVVFILIGFGLLFGEDLFGFIGKPGFDLFTAYENFENVKEDLQDRNADLPKNRLKETTEASNSYAESNQIREGVCIYLTSNNIDKNNQISWKDE